MQHRANKVLVPRARCECLLWCTPALCWRVNKSPRGATQRSGGGGLGFGGGSYRDAPVAERWDEASV